MVIGKIYKIIHNQSDIVYVGSTFNTLRNRWMNHKDRYCQYKKDPKRIMSIHPYFEQHGIENFKIILIKEYEVVDRKHLESKEQLWMNKLKCINKNSAFAITKLTDKLYRKKVMEENPNYNKERYLKHKDKQNDYYESNKDKIKKWRNEKKHCEICNCDVRNPDFKRHERTKKHLNNLR